MFWGSEGLRELLQPLRLANDNTIPTWYSSLILLLSSILLALIAIAKKQQGVPYALHWGILAGIFLLLSIDEVATIHETAGESLGRALAYAVGFTPSGFFYYSWVIPGIAFVLIVLLAYVRFLTHLPRRTALFFLLAGGLFVAGAIGVEMLGSLLDFEVQESGNRMQDMPYSTRILSVVSVAIEEFLEMLSIAIFIYALLSYISSHVKEAATIRIRIDDERK
jgi:hypothetical protein